MNFPNKRNKKPFFLDFSSAIETFYKIGVEDILHFKTWEDGPPNARFTNYHIDFSTVGGDPGTAYLSRMVNNEPIYEISMLCDNLVLNLMWYEFEMIRPFIIHSMSDIVNRYRNLLAIYSKYQSGEINRHSHPIYLDFLISNLRLYQNSIEEIAVVKIDKKKFNKNGGIEGLIQFDTSKRFPYKRKDENVTMKINKSLIENFMFN